MGGPKGKFKIPAKTIYCFFFEFFPLVPLWNNENKSCLNELKFWEASENHKSSICQKFQLSISCGTQKSAKIPLPVGKMIWSFIRNSPQLWKVSKIAQNITPKIKVCKVHKINKCMRSAKLSICQITKCLTKPISFDCRPRGSVFKNLIHTNYTKLLIFTISNEIITSVDVWMYWIIIHLIFRIFFRTVFGQQLAILAIVSRAAFTPLGTHLLPPSLTKAENAQYIGL